MSLSKRAIPVVAAAAALVVCTATAAGATSVIGFGNGTHDNRCANHGSTHTVNSSAAYGRKPGRRGARLLSERPGQLVR